MRRRCLFVVPDPRARISGGNLYNLGLITALREAGVDARVVARDAVRATPDRRDEELCLVDSLYLSDVPRLRPCWLLAHYLPALVEGRSDLSDTERAALLAAEGFVAPSSFMADALSRLAPEGRPVVVVAPGIEVAHASSRVAPSADPHAGVARVHRAVMVANLVPGKGLWELLRALGSRRLPLVVVGSHEHDPEYAAKCRAAAPWVEFLGERTHAETLAMVAASDFLVSSSRMESFGLALAEARALGVPIVALDRGNAAAHADETTGGRLVRTHEELADECIRLALDPVEVARRRDAATGSRPAQRTWAHAATDFSNAFRD
ncbi:MAG: glycosyltransferase family 4 protein [Deltaproteobacteria bacterium]|nr:glycosyltransferase family 4 protein [Deltaproteobacteria bacterium]